MSKKEFCQLLIEQYKSTRHLDSVKDDDCIHSSSLAVAMEYLGLIKNPHYKKYAESRDEILYVGYVDGKVVSITLREFLEDKQWSESKAD